MPPLVKHQNRQVIVDQSNLLAAGLEESFLTADIAAASGTLTVSNVNGFAINQFIWINPFTETSEIVTTHASTTPSQPTITLAANTVFAHYTGEKIYRIEFNRVEISNAPTLAGTKTVLSTQNLQADQRLLPYLDTSVTTGFYFARFNDSVGATFGSYSDGVEYNTPAQSSVGYMIDRSLRDLELSFSEKITLTDCYEWVNHCLKLIKGKLKRWPEHYSYNAILGQAQRGTNIVSMPTDAYDRETNKSLIAVRIGDNRNLQYLPPVEFDAQMEGVRRTQVTTQATAGQTTLEIDNSYDFEDSGSVNVYISGTLYNITYTGVTRSATAGVLTGVPASGDGSITVTIAVDTWVWQDEDEGLPRWFTVRNSNLEFYPLVDANEDNANIYGDYNLVATSVNSDGDTIDYQRYDMVQDYLTFRIKMKARNNGNLDFTDGYYLAFKEELNDAIRTLPQNNRFPIRPSVNSMNKHPSFMKRADLQELDIGSQ